MPAVPGGDGGVAAGGPAGSAGGLDILQQSWLIVLQLNDQASLSVRQPRRFFLTVHGVERDDAVRDLEFAE